MGTNGEKLKRLEVLLTSSLFTPYFIAFSLFLRNACHILAASPPQRITIPIIMTMIAEALIISPPYRRNSILLCWFLRLPSISSRRAGSQLLMPLQQQPILRKI